MAILHEQGLGKTKIAIDLLLYWLSNSVVDSVLLVVKKGLIANWQKELAAHSNVRPRLLSQDKKSNFFAFNSPSRLYLTHFEAVKSEEGRLELFLKTRRVGVIIDEAHKIKNPNTALTKSFFHLSSMFSKKAIMTGTPVANRPYDIWSPVYFLDAGKSLGTEFESFKKDHDFDPVLADDGEQQAAFRHRLAGIFAQISSFTVRETKSSAGISLPSKEFRNLYTDWETVQHELYSDIRDEFRTVVVRDGMPTEENAEELLKRLLRLVQIASNPLLVDASYRSIPGKFQTLQDLLSDIVRSGEKAIVWTSFTQNVDWLSQELREFGIAKIHGKLGMADRNKFVNRFLSDPSVAVMVATPGAAKEGLTLTVANHVIFYDRSFSLDDYLQSQDRIHRISQNKTCFIYNLIMKDSIDLWVDTLLKEKELAARLGQGDITEEEYANQATFDMFEMLKSVLSLSAERKSNELG